LSCLVLSCLQSKAIKPTEAETSCLVFAQVEADSDGNIDEAITGYEGAAAALRHYGRDTPHAAGYLLRRILVV
jgi:hypothetical protein